MWPASKLTVFLSPAHRHFSTYMCLQIFEKIYFSDISFLLLSYSRPSPYWGHISLSVAKTTVIALITSRFHYCNSLLYNIASKDILKLQCVQNCLARVVHGLLGFPILSHFWNLFTGSLFNLASFSNSALLPIKLFLLENLHIYFPCFL